MPKSGPYGTSWENPAVEQFDVVIIGAGIVGLATARALIEAEPARSVVLVEKEAAPARHQSGHNSGVIHSGIYYKPGSAKATLVREGRDELLAFCAHHTIAVDQCGKVIVAIDEHELPRLAALEERAAANGIAAERIGPDELRVREPFARGVAALVVPSAAIVSYPAVCEALRRDLEAAGVFVRTGFTVDAIEERDGTIAVRDRASGARVIARSLVNCAGLHSDRIARLAGADTGGVRIMPFRGEYYELVEDRRYLCRSLIYPVPDPAFPFLGVHLTRMIDGSIHAGPNAVPALRREGYRRTDIDLRDVRELLGSRRTYMLAKKYWRTGAGEIHRSLRKRAFVHALQALCPDIERRDLVPSHAGVRAQAIDASGDLLDDFAFATTPRSVHVVNAPSPAATASLAIGRAVAARMPTFA
jgi:L-2-hydroxyglutarate oxidase